MEGDKWKLEDRQKGMRVSINDSLEMIDWAALQAEETSSVEETAAPYGRNIVSQFEDLRVWQAGRALANGIYDATETDRFSRDHALTNQSRRAAISITSNIAEGFERGSRAEFALFLNYAKGSAGELRSQLHHALDRRYISNEEHERLVDECILVSRQLFTMIQRLRQQAAS